MPTYGDPVYVILTSRLIPWAEPQGMEPSMNRGNQSMAAHSHSSQGRMHPSITLGGHDLLKAVGLNLVLWPVPNALGSDTAWRAQHPEIQTKTTANCPKPRGDASVLDGLAPGDGYRVSMPNTGFVMEILWAAQHKLAAAQKHFWSFQLPDGVLLEPRQREALVKQALAAVLPPQSAAVPLPESNAAMGQSSPLNRNSLARMGSELDTMGRSPRELQLPSSTLVRAAANAIIRLGSLIRGARRRRKGRRMRGQVLKKRAATAPPSAASERRGRESIRSRIGSLGTTVFQKGRVRVASVNCPKAMALGRPCNYRNNVNVAASFASHVDRVVIPH